MLFLSPPAIIAGGFFARRMHGNMRRIHTHLTPDGMRCASSLCIFIYALCLVRALPQHHRESICAFRFISIFPHFFMPAVICRFVSRLLSVIQNASFHPYEHRKAGNPAGCPLLTL